MVLHFHDYFKQFLFTFQTHEILFVYEEIHRHTWEVPITHRLIPQQERRYNS